MSCDKGRTSVGVRLAMSGLAIFLLLLATGCRGLLDQSEITRGNHGSPSEHLLVDILPSIDPLDHPNPEFPDAEAVKGDDLKVITTDYVITPNDLITVSIFDLVNQGIESVRTARVSETGMLSLPMLSEPVRAAGLTEAQLQKAIAAKYKEAGLLPNAQVAVTVVEARGRTFNITGAVARPGQYAILESDFRVFQALVQAGDTVFPSEHLYVIRKRISEKPSARTSEGPATRPTTGPAELAPTTGPAELAPGAQGPIVARPILAVMAEPAGNQDQSKTQVGGEGRFGTVEGKSVPISPTTQPTAAEGTMLAPTTQPGAEVTAKPQPAYQFGASLTADEDQRVIRVNLAALKNGDLSQNVVIRPGDVVYVPQALTGVYYMSGHVSAPGAYNFAGQKVTLLNAVAAARNLDPLAVPSRTDVVRRIGGDKEVFVRVDLWKISIGKEPDIFLKPNDMVQVGTDFYPPFLQAIRGAFRITYGFGFLYDRNYAPAQPTRFAQ